MVAAALLIGAAPAYAAQTHEYPANTPVASWAQPSYKVYLDMKAKAHGGTHYTDANKLPNWSGLWDRDRSIPGSNPDSTSPQDLGATTADLTPRFLGAYLTKIYNTGHDNQWDPLSYCLPSGFPRFLGEPYPHEFIITANQTWWIAEWQSETRRFYTDGRGHRSADAGAELPWEGDTIAFWDGDTLVAHTLYVPHGQYRRLNPDFSSETSTVEQIQRVSPDLIEDHITIWDPKGLKKPWPIMFAWRLDDTPGLRLDYFSCEANNNVIRTPNGGSNFILPGETVNIQRSYREPQVFYLSPVQKKLFLTDDPITLSAEQKAWLRVNLKSPERYASVIGPVTKQEQAEREAMAKKMMAEREALRKQMAKSDMKKKKEK